MYLLDTNVCIRIINGRSPNARRRLMQIPADDIIVCSIVRAELFYGAAKSQTPELTRRKQDLFLEPFKSQSFDDVAADRYASVRLSLERVGTPIGTHDMEIAAIALANRLTVVTHNRREFSRVQGLMVEDWESP
jgi:tRNA(fMet)-specific endonuclease VapC